MSGAATIENDNFLVFTSEIISFSPKTDDFFLFHAETQKTWMLNDDKPFIAA